MTCRTHVEIEVEPAMFGWWWWIWSTSGTVILKGGVVPRTKRGAMRKAERVAKRLTAPSRQRETYIYPRDVA